MNIHAGISGTLRIISTSPVYVLAVTSESLLNTDLTVCNVYVLCHHYI